MRRRRLPRQNAMHAAAEVGVEWLQHGPESSSKIVMRNFLYLIPAGSSMDLVLDAVCNWVYIYAHFRHKVKEREALNFCLGVIGLGVREESAEEIYSHILF